MADEKKELDRTGDVADQDNIPWNDPQEKEGEGDNTRLMSDSQTLKVSQFYEFVARCLPLEGRDYKIRFTRKGEDGVGVDFFGLTDIGKAFVEHVLKSFTDARKTNPSNPSRALDTQDLN